MRRQHFESLQPVCPRCRVSARRVSPLAIGHVERESTAGIVEGVLHCTSAECQLEYPILDGAPLLVPDIRRYVSDHLPTLLARTDLSGRTESLIGDCVGPATYHDATRQHLSTYTWDHYGDLDPDEGASDELRPGSIVRCLERGLAMVQGEIDGPILDIGCAAGRTSFELARRFETPVLGIDINFSLLGVARRVLEQGTVQYPRRRVGIVYDRRELQVDTEGSEHVDFWVCDALAMPFRDATFGMVTALNVLDCLTAPSAMLGSVRDVMRPGSPALLSTPYDWSTNVTPLESWIGGHSQRGPGAGASEPLLRALLTEGAHPQSVPGLEIIGEDEDVPWQTRLHDRSSVSYRAHLLAVEARPSSSAC